MKTRAASRELAADSAPALVRRPGSAPSIVDRRAATAQLVRQQRLADTAPGTQRLRQFQAMAGGTPANAQRNDTGLPDALKANDAVALEREADSMGACALASPSRHGEATVSGEPGLADPEALLQRKSIKLEGDNLTELMKARFATAYDQFNSAILATSPLASQDNNQVLIWGISQASSDMRDFGSTTIYLGNDAYQDDDYRNFTELWSVSLANQIDPQTPVRIVIAVNLTINRSIEELYATLLHEWFVHAVKWEGTLGYIRQGEGRFALGWIQGQGHVRRAEGEHAAFAQSTDEEIAGRADALGLTGSERDKTVEKMKADRDRHRHANHVV